MKSRNGPDGVAIIKKPDDISQLEEKLISLYETKTHADVSRYGLLLAEHVIGMAGMPMNDTIESCFEVSRAWQDGRAKVRQTRQIAFSLHRLAREEADPIRVLVYRVLGQVAATPHVKRHALAASNYAVKLINSLYPHDTDRVRQERETQISMMERV